MTEKEELFQLLSALVAIDSVNCDLIPGAKGECEIAAYVRDWLSRRGIEVERQATRRPGRSNVVGWVRGRGGGRSLMLNAHMDTVGVAGMSTPFSTAVKDGRLFGRGAMDTKGALAAFMSALVGVSQLDLCGDVVLAAVVDEEYASAGTEAVAAAYHTDAAIVGEPTGLQVVTAHKGFIWFDVETRGIAAHGSLPDVGVDAIAKMGGVLVEIERLAERLRQHALHPVLGSGSIHASLIRGGQEFSSYPAACTLSLERRTVPGETVDGVEKELRAVLELVGSRDPSFVGTLRTRLAREPFEARKDDPIVLAISRQVASYTGRNALLSGMSGWLESALLVRAGISSVVFGPAGDGLHGETEWVDLESVWACREIVRGTIREYCAPCGTKMG